MLKPQKKFYRLLKIWVPPHYLYQVRPDSRLGALPHTGREGARDHCWVARTYDWLCGAFLLLMLQKGAARFRFYRSM